MNKKRKQWFHHEGGLHLFEDSEPILYFPDVDADKLKNITGKGEEMTASEFFGENHYPQNTYDGSDHTTHDPR